MIDKDIEILKELAEDTIRYKMVETDAYMAGAITRVLKEVETYKKIEDFMADFIVENIDRIDTKPWCRFLVYNSSSKWLSSGKKEKGL